MAVIIEQFNPRNSFSQAKGGIEKIKKRKIVFKKYCINLNQSITYCTLTMLDKGVTIFRIINQSQIIQSL